MKEDELVKRKCTVIVRSGERGGERGSGKARDRDIGREDERGRE